MWEAALCPGPGLCRAVNRIFRVVGRAGGNLELVVGGGRDKGVCVKSETSLRHVSDSVSAVLIAVLF